MKKPAWLWDYLSHDSIKYGIFDKDTDAEDLGSFFGSQITGEFGWKDAEWFLGEWNGHSSNKGVVRVDDAKQSIKSGFDAVWLSNHGGR